MRTLRVATAMAMLVAGSAGGQTYTPGEPPRDTARERAEREARGFQQLVRSEEPAIKEHAKRIDAELETLEQGNLNDDAWAREWAGSYYTGDGTGMNVLIKVAPKSGLTYTWHGCLGLYDANHGQVVEAFPGGLKVRFVLDETRSHYQYISTTLYFVRWGPRRYLVPETQMLKLVNNYNRGAFARGSMYGIPRKFEPGEQAHRFGEANPAGKPLVPEKYARLLLDRPAVYRVTKVTPQPERPVTKGVKVLELRVELEGGRDKGAFEGMTLEYRKGMTFGPVEIDRVEDATCAGMLRLFGGDAQQFEPPTVGETLRFPEPDPFAPQPEDKPPQNPK